MKELEKFYSSVSDTFLRTLFIEFYAGNWTIIIDSLFIGHYVTRQFPLRQIGAFRPLEEIAQD